MSTENITTTYTIERLDHLGIIAGVIKDLKIVEFINDRLGTYHGESLSAGETVAGMIINGLGFSNRPMSLTPQFFKQCPLWLLFHEGVKADDFNRFKLGRILDRCHGYGTELLFSEISQHVCRQEKVDTRFNHLDTTSFTLFGNYSGKIDDDTVKIALGYSKDHRPDLKQIMLEMMVSQDGGIPLLAKCLNGNVVFCVFSVCKNAQAYNGIADGDAIVFVSLWNCRATDASLFGGIGRNPAQSDSSRDRKTYVTLDISAFIRHSLS